MGAKLTQLGPKALPPLSWVLKLKLTQQQEIGLLRPHLYRDLHRGVLDQADRTQDEGRRTLCLHQWCLVLKRSQSWWTTFPWCQIVYVKMTAISSAQRIHQWFCCCCFTFLQMQIQKMHYRKNTTVFAVFVFFFLVKHKWTIQLCKPVLLEWQ